MMSSSCWGASSPCASVPLLVDVRREATPSEEGEEDEEAASFRAPVAEARNSSSSSSSSSSRTMTIGAPWAICGGNRVTRASIFSDRPRSSTAAVCMQFWARLGRVSRGAWIIRSCTMASSSASTSAEPVRPLKAVKSALRKEISARLQALDDQYISQQSALIAARLLELEAVQKGRSVSIYLSMPSKEVPTYPIIDRLFASSPRKELFVPKVVGPKSENMLMLPVASSAEIDGFPRSKWGIPEPPVEPPREDGTYSGRIDVVVVPGVAFDRQCNRLGHGKGYYDCFLERLTRSNAEKGASKPYTVGLALSEQLVDSIPMDSFDLPLDALVTPDALYVRD